jgi:glycosyltransferase involved in cell wall biosynthesis
VSFLGWQSDEAVRRHYREARLLVFPGVEDFGMVPVEAMACGLPVVAFGEGGVLETVSEPEHGVFFHEPTPAALANAVERALQLPFDPERCDRTHCASRATPSAAAWPTSSRPRCATSIVTRPTSMLSRHDRIARRSAES